MPESVTRCCLLTGAKRIGADLALALAERGSDIALTYRSSESEATTAADAVRRLGRRAITIRADVSREADCQAAVAEVEREFGRLDVLVNMASMYRQVAFDAMTGDDWRRQLGTDLDGTFNCTRAAVPLMRRSGGGHVVNFTDWVAASGRPRYQGYVAYYVAKAGVMALTEALALELASDRILVNAIAPGPILAPPGTSQTEMEAVAKSTPLGGWGGPTEIVKAVLLLVESGFITGETIRVDGGRHLS